MWKLRANIIALLLFNFIVFDTDTRHRGVWLNVGHIYDNAFEEDNISLKRKTYLDRSDTCFNNYTITSKCPIAMCDHITIKVSLCAHYSQ